MIFISLILFPCLRLLKKSLRDCCLLLRLCVSAVEGFLFLFFLEDPYLDVSVECINNVVVQTVQTLLLFVDLDQTSVTKNPSQ